MGHRPTKAHRHIVNLNRILFKKKKVLPIYTVQEIHKSAHPACLKDPTDVPSGAAILLAALGGSGVDATLWAWCQSWLTTTHPAHFLIYSPGM